MSEIPKIVPVILSGGGGTRLWPMSTASYPKQFLALTGDETMFQMTARRVADAQKFSAPIIVANLAHCDLVAEQLAAIGMEPNAIILEPCARNTAPAIALAALGAPAADAVLLVMPSDHVIADLDAFVHAIDLAVPDVRTGWLATLGITPNQAETGYGYIRLGEALGVGVHKVDRFVEKPDAVAAHAMVSDGNHLWNGGIFLFRADIYLGILAAFAPDILFAAQQAMEKATRRGKMILPDADAFATSPSDSIDYAVMEKAERVMVAPVSMGWSDVGSWDALYEIGAKDDQENHIAGDVLAIEATGNLIRSDGRKITVAGVKDHIIVATSDHILIVPRGRAQDVKKIVAALE